MTRSFFAALAAIGSLFAAQAAQAATYDFSYTASWGVVSGTIIGVLQPDNNTIDVSSIIDPEFDGAPGPAVPVITTLADFFSKSGLTVSGPTVPEVTLDGANDNVLACTTTACSDGFFFDQAGVDGHFGAGAPEFAVGPSYGDTGTDLFERYDVTKESITAVPEPATWAMMLMGLTALGLAMRRRRLSERAA